MRELRCVGRGRCAKAEADGSCRRSFAPCIQRAYQQVGQSSADRSVATGHRIMIVETHGHSPFLRAPLSLVECPSSSLVPACPVIDCHRVVIACFLQLSRLAQREGLWAWRSVPKRIAAHNPGQGGRSICRQWRARQLWLRSKPALDRGNMWTVRRAQLARLNGLGEQRVHSIWRGPLLSPIAHLYRPRSWPRVRVWSGSECKRLGIGTASDERGLGHLRMCSVASAVPCFPASHLGDNSV